VAEAEARQAGLIVVTTHGRSGLGRWVFGSVTETILARSSVPVLVARAWSPPSPLVPPEGKTTIVVPLDGSPLAESALSQAEESARVLGGEICLVRVISLPYISPDLDEEMGPIYDLAVREELERDARAYLTSIARRLSATGLGVTSAVEFGNPAGTILTTARERKAGLIVMATHGRTGLAQTLLGSVALEMLHRGDLPVMFVRGAAQPNAF
ncbi:MAG TPA: universal stress protein, partial [Chloroflexota bacterium]|nr:universal stress protein [Chloroflexota bacterium]